LGKFQKSKSYSVIETPSFKLGYCCDRKSRAACAQSFAPLQQAIIEIMRRNLSYYCSLALHI